MKRFLVLWYVLAVGLSFSGHAYSAIETSALPTTEHEIILTPLSPNTGYYYAVISAVPIVRGPYLQLATATSMTVKWRTGVATTSTVDYRLTPFAGSSSFVTSPVPGSEKSTRIWVLGDSGKRGTDAKAVRDSYLSYTGARGTDVWLMLGDNAYNSGTDIDYQNKVFDMHPTTLPKVAVWAAFGNHDAVSADSIAQTGPYFDIFKLPAQAEAGGVASGTEAYYSFDYGKIHFICLDSEQISRSLSGSSMLQWLTVDLADANIRSEWIIAFWHRPPYSKGTHDSDTESNMVQMRENVLPVLEANGVDLVFTGHSHSYERSVLLDGHYGPSGTLLPSMVLDAGSGQEAGTGVYTKDITFGKAHKGTVYVVAATSGMLSNPLKWGPLNHPAMFVSSYTLGSMVIDVAGNRLDARFINNVGAVFDSFSIVHKIIPDLTPPVVTPPADIRILTTNASGIASTDAAIVAFLAGGSATDNVGVVGGVSTSAVGGGALPDPFPVGATVVQFNASDEAGNLGMSFATVYVDLDSDNDGVGDQWDLYPTNPDYALEPDTDLDGLADIWEITNFGDLTTANGTSDTNGDGVLDIDHFNAGSDPNAVVPTGSVKNDFDGDGKSDILWRHAVSGQVYIWLMNGTTRTSSGSPATVTDLNWQIKGAGDFDGDGKNDILWRHAVSGQVYIWLMNGTTRTSSGSPATVTDLNWQIKGTGDFDGDGKSDILWRHAVSGQVYTWLMNGTARASSGSPGTVADLNWQIKGIGDFDGDGKSDILWRHAVSGQVYTWLMNGTARASSGSPGMVADLNWQIKNSLP